MIVRSALAGADAGGDLQILMPGTVTADLGALDDRAGAFHQQRKDAGRLRLQPHGGAPSRQLTGGGFEFELPESVTQRHRDTDTGTTEYWTSVDSVRSEFD